MTLNIALRVAFGWPGWRNRSRVPAKHEVLSHHNSRMQDFRDDLRSSDYGDGTSHNREHLPWWLMQQCSSLRQFKRCLKTFLFGSWDYGALWLFVKTAQYRNSLTDLLTYSRLWDNFYQVWPSTTYPCLDYSVSDAYMLCHAVTLTFDLLTLNFYSTSRVMRLTVQKFERNRIIHRWFIDNLARFRHVILGVGHFCPTVLRGAWTQLHQTWRGRKAISPTQEVCISIRIACCVFKCERLKIDWCWKRRQISHLLPPVKVRGGVDETYDPTSEIHLMAIHCMVAEHGGLVIKRKKEKESSWVKLKAFLTNVERPNKIANRATITCRILTFFSRIASI